VIDASAHALFERVTQITAENQRLREALIEAKRPEFESVSCLNLLLRDLRNASLWLRNVPTDDRAAAAVDAALAAIQVKYPRTREAIPRGVRAEVTWRDKGRCVKCGSEDDLHLDHIVPWSKGGPAIVGNLQLLCRPCNLAKGDRLEEPAA
jgi:hypothetical protein